MSLIEISCDKVVPSGCLYSDFVCYWFERARQLIADGKIKRAGLLATQSIRGGKNRKTLQRIKGSGDIFMAWSDRKWILDGAAVHVSYIGFDDGAETGRLLDGQSVGRINSDLTSGIDLTSVGPLEENKGTAFQGVTQGGPFDIPEDLARDMLASPNPDSRSNADVVRPWINASDIAGNNRKMWIIDFPPGTSELEAALYEEPFAFILKHVKGKREQSRTTTNEWWIHERPRTEMRKSLIGLDRYLATPQVSKHRIFVWLTAETLPENTIIVFAKEDDLTAGILQSSIHETWARRTGTQLRERESGFRYTPTTTFETFPFPNPTDEQKGAIEIASRNLSQLREGWLKAVDDRTLTGLYNDKPTWLTHASSTLNQAVAAAYGWDDVPSDEEEILKRLLALNTERSAID